MIVWLASYPRSGNTYFRLLLNRMCGLPTHSIYSLKDDGHSSPEDKSTLAKLVGQSETECDIDLIQQDVNPHFLKTHEVAGEDDFPAIVLVRDGRDSLVSYAHFILKISHGIENATTAQLEQTMEELIRSAAFGGWGRNVMSWAARVGFDRLVRYERLIADPVSTMRSAIRSAGLVPPQHDEIPPSFAELHAHVPWFFRRGIVGSWREEMPKRIQKLFLEKNEEAMERLGMSA
jgi:hypothetical protein